jgi:hypothetical protein
VARELTRCEDELEKRKLQKKVDEFTRRTTQRSSSSLRFVPMSVRPVTFHLVPVVAVVGGERVEAWTFDAPAWEQLKRDYRRLGLTMSCGRPGIPVRSPRGVYFFRHENDANSGLHDGGDESQQHYRAKAIVAETARRLGWTATVERRSDDGTWIADVLLEHSSLQKPVAVEIQWSRQSNAEFHRRQDRYTEAGVDCFWIVGEVNSVNVDGVPSHPMSGDVDNLAMILPMGRLPRRLLPEDAAAVLPFTELLTTCIEVASQRALWWNDECGHPLTFWRVSGFRTQTPCRQQVVVRDLSGYRTHVSVRPDVLVEQEVREAIAASRLPLPTHYRLRRTKAAGKEYLAHICPYCSAVQGDAFIKLVTRFNIPHEVQVLFRPDILERAHRCTGAGDDWCVPGDRPDHGLTFPADHGRVEVSTAAEPHGTLPAPWPEGAKAQAGAWKSPAQRRREMAAEKAAAEKRKREAAAARLAAWQQSAEWRKLLDGFDGQWPSFLQLNTASILPLPVEEWQGLLYLRFIHGRNHGDIDPTRLFAKLRSLEPDIGTTDDAIREWLKHLTGEGILTKTRAGRTEPGRFCYIVDKTPPEAPPNWLVKPEDVAGYLRPSREEEVAAARRHLLGAAGRPPVLPVRGSIPNPQAAELRKPEPYASPSGRCVFCGKKLDPIYSGQGYHDRCAPGLRAGSRWR